MFGLILFLQQTFIGGSNLLKPFGVLFRGIFSYELKICPFDFFLVRVLLNAKNLIQKIFRPLVLRVIFQPLLCASDGRSVLPCQF